MSSRQSAGTLLVRQHGPVLSLVLSLPARKNALTRPVLEVLRRTVAAPPDGVRAVVLSGDPAGQAFSAGFHLGQIDDAEVERGLDPISHVAHAIEAASIPVVAAIDGAAYGGALDLALSCDVRIASPVSSFGMPPVKLGLVYPLEGMARLVARVGHGRAALMLLTAAPVSAAEAAEWGLVDRVHAAPLQAALAAASQMAALPPLALADTLAVLRRMRAGAPDTLDAAAARRARALGSAELRAALVRAGAPVSHA